MVCRLGSCLGLLALLGACTSERAGCKPSDWQAAGYHSGQSAGRIDDGLSAMAGHCSGDEGHEAAWRRGYALGMNEYCQPASGWTLGHTAVGDDIAKHCPASLHQDFLANLRLGRRMHKLHGEQQQLSRQLSSSITVSRRTHLQNRLGKLRQELADLTTLARMRGFLPPPAAPDP